MAASFTRTLPADVTQLPALVEEIEAWVDGNGMPFAEGARLMVALDEILTNIATHGGGTITIDLIIAGNRIDVVVADDGPRFDPLARPEPDVELGIDDRDIGGLGIHLVRTMMDDVGYAYENGRNRLQFGKTF